METSNLSRVRNAHSCLLVVYILFSVFRTSLVLKNTLFGYPFVKAKTFLRFEKKKKVGEEIVIGKT